MARGLSGVVPARRRVAVAALVLAVVALHAVVTQEVIRRMAEFASLQAMPQRLQVSYVRELEVAPPPVAAPVVVAPAPPKRKRAAPAEPQVAAPAPPASAPEDVAEAPPPPEVAPEPIPPPVAEAAPAAADPAASAPAVAGAEAFDWPASTRLTYTLTGNYRGEINGDAQVEWIRVGTRYQVHIDISVGPLISRRMTSQGELVGDRLLPSRYDEETRVLFREPRRVTILLGPDEIVLANGEKRARAAGVQDAASQFIQLAALFTTRPELLQPGNTVEVLLALRNRVGPWVYDIVGEEELRTPFALLATYHLRPRRPIMSGGNELTAEIWYAPQLRNLPVRLRIRQDADTFVDLLLARRPEIAAQ